MQFKVYLRLRWWYVVRLWSVFQLTDVTCTPIFFSCRPFPSSPWEIEADYIRNAFNCSCQGTGESGYRSTLYLSSFFPPSSLSNLLSILFRLRSATVANWTSTVVDTTRSNLYDPPPNGAKEFQVIHRGRKSNCWNWRPIGWAVLWSAWQELS